MCELFLPANFLHIPLCLFTQDELLERALSTSSMMSSSVYDNIRNHSTTSFLENLESQVKQKEGEILQLQVNMSVI